MRFIEMQGFCVRLDQQEAFQQWLTENEDRIRKSYPKGSEYGGVYGAVFTSEKQAGEWYWLDFHDSYAALDTAAALAKDPTSDYAKIGREFGQFLDFDRLAGYSKTLLKSAIDVTVFDAPKA